MDGELWRCTTLRRSARYGWLVLALSVAPPARAEEEGDATETAAARRLAVDGIRLAERGHCPEALDKLSRAEKLRHSPIVLEQLGQCQIAQGMLVEGSESLRRVLREESPPNPSPALAKALSRAESTLAATKPKIAWLTISLVPSVAGAELSVDGRPLSSALLGDQSPTDPGQHVVEASAPGFIESSSTLFLAEGEKRTIVLQLEIDPHAAAAPATPVSAEVEATRRRAASREQAAVPSPGRTYNRAPAYITWGLSGLAAGAGGTLGFLAWRGKRDLESECPSRECPAGSLDKLDHSRRYGTLATAAFAVAGAGVVLGTVLFATASPSAPSAAQGDPRGVASEGSGLRIGAFVGVGQAGVHGHF